MHSLAFGKSFHNSKLFFSNSELGKILSCYSVGVSKGKWKDYAISFKNNEVNFLMFKHSLVIPDCVLTKTKKIKLYLNLILEIIKRIILTELKIC